MCDRTAASERLFHCVVIIITHCKNKNNITLKSNFILTTKQHNLRISTRSKYEINKYFKNTFINTYILLDVLVYNIAVYFYEFCSIWTSTQFIIQLLLKKESYKETLKCQHPVSIHEVLNWLKNKLVKPV